MKKINNPIVNNIELQMAAILHKNFMKFAKSAAGLHVSDKAAEYMATKATNSVMRNLNKILRANINNENDLLKQCMKYGSKAISDAYVNYYTNGIEADYVPFQMVQMTGQFINDFGLKIR